LFGLVSRIVGGKGLFALSTLIAANNRYGITGPLTSPIVLLYLTVGGQRVTVTSKQRKEVGGK
jgi:hypothetical protein